VIHSDTSFSQPNDGQNLRDSLVYEILERNLSTEKQNSEDMDLIGNFKVSEVLISRARASRLITSGNYFESMNWLISSSQWSFAHEILSKYVAPCVFASLYAGSSQKSEEKHTFSQVLSWLETLHSRKEQIPEWKNCGHHYFSHLSLKKDLSIISESQSQNGENHISREVLSSLRQSVVDHAFDLSRWYKSLETQKKCLESSEFLMEKGQLLLSISGTSNETLRWAQLLDCYACDTRCSTTLSVSHVLPLSPEERRDLLSVLVDSYQASLFM